MRVSIPSYTQFGINPLRQTRMAARRVDPDISGKLEKLPQNIRKELSKWFKASKKVKIFVTGTSGVGKSTLVNGLLGVEFAKEGHELDPETSQVTRYKKKIRGVKVKVWDSPGLQDCTSRDDHYLAHMKRKCKGFDICVYCISATELRLTEECADILAMQKLTNVFGKELWNHALFVLTFANLVKHTDSDILEANEDRQRELFQSKLELWKKELTAALMKESIGVDEEVAKRIEVIPAGYHSQPALLDRDHWLSPVWFAALYAMNPQSQPAMIKLNRHRIVNSSDEICDDDLKKFLQEQPIIFSKRGAAIGEKYGKPEIGEHVGRHYGLEDIMAMGLHNIL